MTTHYDPNDYIPPEPVDPCEGLDGFEEYCPGLSGWHYEEKADEGMVDVCALLVQTNGGSCKDYCESQNRTCMYAYDNKGFGCDAAKDHDNDGIDATSCTQTQANQVCGCSGPDSEAPPDDNHTNGIDANFTHWDIDAFPLQEATILYRSVKYTGSATDLETLKTALNQDPTTGYCTAFATNLKRV